MLRSILQTCLRPLGLEIVRNADLPINQSPDIDDSFKAIYRQCEPYTLTSTERMFALYKAIRYIGSNQIPGSIVECGVWRGGSMMLAALTLQSLRCTDRALYLYDTFEGMTKPTEYDVDLGGSSAAAQLNGSPKKANSVWAAVSLDEVKRNIEATGYPTDRILYIQGDVLKTIPKTLPDSLSLLRLDTDWYESTLHEMKYLYPLLSIGGVLIIDDYGHWKGARQATDEYFAAQGIYPLLNSIDYTARLIVKVR